MSTFFIFNFCGKPAREPRFFVSVLALWYSLPLFGFVDGVGMSAPRSDALVISSTRHGAIIIFFISNALEKGFYL